MSQGAVRASDSDNEAVIVVSESPSVPGPVTPFPDEHEVASDDGTPIFPLPATVKHSTTPADLTSVRVHLGEPSDVPRDDIRAGVADPKNLRVLPTDAERKLTAQVLRNDKAIVAAKG